MTEDEQQAYNAVNQYGSKREAAKQLGISRSTLRNRYDRAEAAMEADAQGVIFPSIPPDDVPVEELIQIQTKRFKAKEASHKAKEWMPIRIGTSDPSVLAFMGDPHVDDDGCNWPKLLSDIELLKQDNVFTVNIGDTTNNWVGRLARLYADQHTSRKDAQKFAGWLLHDAGINWLAWLLGNHDVWGDGQAIYETQNRSKIVMEDWEARFRAVFQNGFEAKIWAAHNFKGNSQWNTLHGPMKAAKMRGGSADLYVCGHTHTGAIHTEEEPDTGRLVHCMRARGYKRFDSHAKHHGFADKQLGETVAAVVNPTPKRKPKLSRLFTILRRLSDTETHYENPIEARQAFPKLNS